MNQSSSAVENSDYEYGTYFKHNIYIPFPIPFNTNPVVTFPHWYISSGHTIQEPSKFPCVYGVYSTGVKVWPNIESSFAYKSHSFMFIAVGW